MTHVLARFDLVLSSEINFGRCIFGALSDYESANMNLRYSIKRTTEYSLDAHTAKLLIRVATREVQ